MIQPLSILQICAVFLLGASVGALLVSIHRQSNLERIRSKFERDLHDIVTREHGDSQNAINYGRRLPSNSRNFAATFKDGDQLHPELVPQWSTLVKPMAQQPDNR